MKIDDLSELYTFADLKQLAEERCEFIRICVKKHLEITGQTHQQFSDMHCIPRPSLTAFLRGHNNKIAHSKLDSLAEG
jgi:hypothetical protein